LMLIEEGEFWKLNVRDPYVSIVRKIVTETELPKGVLETLAVIAFKYPILQSDLIKLRTNKSYDHLAELEAAGYVSRQKHGRTNLIKLTEKFFKYFDLTEEKLKDQFKDFDSIAKAIKEKEEEVDKIKEDQQKRAIELKQEDEKIRKEIESLDEKDEEFNIPLKVYKSQPEEKKEDTSEPAPEPENLPALVEHKETELAEAELQSQESTEIIKEPEKEEPIHSNQPPADQEQAEQEETQEEKVETKKHEKKRKDKKRSKGIHLSPELEAVAEKKAEEIIYGGPSEEGRKSYTQSHKSQQ